MCVIRKIDEKNNLLGCRVVSGDLEQVSAGIKNLHSRSSSTPDQNDNYWSTTKFPTEEGLLSCKRRLSELENPK